MNAVWTILIPTLGERAALFRRLMDALMPQVDAAGGAVKVVAYWNNGDPGLPEIRQRLVESVTTEYLSFIDDDDMVPEYFVSEVLKALESAPDYVGWQVRYLADRKDRGLIDHSLAHGAWREEKSPKFPAYRLLRDISHINPMRTAVAQKADFRVARAGQIEDRPWVDQVRRSGLLKTEAYIPRPMYEYRWERRVSRWQRPARIRRGGFTPTKIDSPNFSYFSEEQAVAERPKIRRLGVIVPTRGRPQNIEKVVVAWNKTGAWAVADLILAIDRDDPEYRNYLKIQQSIERPARILVHEVEMWRPMVHKLDSAAIFFAQHYGALGFAGDDHLPRTAGWAQLYLDTLSQHGPACMVHGDDGYQGAKLSTEWAVTSDAVKALGRMVPAPVEHLYCDNAMMDLFGGAGALWYLPQVKIEHMHPVAGKADSDDQYRRVNSSRQGTADRAAHRRWQVTDLPSQVKIIRSLRGEPATAPRRPIRPGRTTRMPQRSPFPHHFRQIRGATPEPIMIALADLAAQVPADQEIVELGVFQGGTALRLAWGAAQGNGAHVTGIDPWDLPGNVYDPPFTDSASERWARHWVLSMGYSSRIQLVKAFSEQVALHYGLESRPIGLLFVDGDHTEEGARRDIELWAPHLAPGAVIAVDDYGHPDWPGVAQAVDKLVDEGFLAPIELYHDRLAVTKLAVTAPSAATTEQAGKGGAGVPAAGAVTAITSEGIEPAPVPDILLNGVPATADVTLGQLRAEARRRGLTGAAQMRREALIEALSEE